MSLVLVLEQIALIVDQAFGEDWELVDIKDDKTQPGFLLIRARKDIGRRSHMVWALYRWLKRKYVEEGSELRKYSFPMTGDGLPSIDGAPKRWEWSSPSIRIDTESLRWLRAGPLLTSSGDVLVEPGTVLPRQTPTDMTAEVRRCADDRELYLRALTFLPTTNAVAWFVAQRVPVLAFGYGRPREATTPIVHPQNHRIRAGLHARLHTSDSDGIADDFTSGR